MVAEQTSLEEDESPSGPAARKTRTPLGFDEPDHHGQTRYRILSSLGRGSFGEA
jgi:hypothetical protein